VVDTAVLVVFSTSCIDEQESCIEDVEVLTERRSEWGYVRNNFLFWRWKFVVKTVDRVSGDQSCA